ncbi:MAG TPA: glycosyltransferase [Burkholderiaceae bacterium]|nr:glycosyltransferase [Burkholderiaceae bacterium]
MNHEPQLHANHAPTVSICVPTYQAQATLEATLRSVLAQTYPALDILIVDNASTDGTVELARRVCAGDARVRLIQNPVNVGGEGNFRRCVEFATGDLIAVFHADDLYDPRIVEKQVSFLVNHPQAAAVFTEATLIDANDGRLGERRTPARLVAQQVNGCYTFWPVFRAILRHHNFLMTPSVMARREVYRSLRLFDAARFGSSADLDVWLQILSQAPAGILRECLMGYRISPEQGSTALIRQRTDRADFFKVIDTWMADPAVAAAITASDRRNYAWLDKANRVARAIAMAERDPRADLEPLLGALYSPSEVARALLQRPRAAVCALLAMLLRGGARRGTAPSRRPLITRLRGLAKI